MPEINFSELELREIGLWPLILRVLVIFTAGALTFAAIYFFLLSDQMQNLETQSKLEDDKRAEFKTKYNLAANLDAYRKQMVDIEASYKQVARELPSSSQVPQLVDTISQEAQINGLTADSIKPGEEKSLSGFYKQLPLNLVLSGTYNGIGGFVSDMSKIPRIVTLHDFSVKRSGGAATSSKQDQSIIRDGTTKLTFTVEAKTYWLSTEPDATKAGKKPAGGAKPATPGMTPPGARGIPKPGEAGAPPASGDRALGPGKTSPEAVKGPGVPFKRDGTSPPAPAEEIK